LVTLVGFLYFSIPLPLSHLGFPQTIALLLLEIIACPFRTKDIGPYGAWTMALLWFFPRSGRQVVGKGAGTVKREQGADGCIYLDRTYGWDWV